MAQIDKHFPDEQPRNRLRKGWQEKLDLAPGFRSFLNSASSDSGQIDKETLQVFNDIRRNFFNGLIRTGLEPGEPTSIS